MALVEARGEIPNELTARVAMVAAAAEVVSVKVLALMARLSPVTVQEAADWLPARVKREVGAAVPRPSLLLVLSQKYWALFCDNSPPAPANNALPCVIVENNGAAENVLAPAKVWVLVDTSPRAVAEASGRLIVRVPPSDVGEPETFTSVPDVPIVVLNDELASCPLVIPAFEAKLVVVSPLKLVVAITPFIVPVSTPVEVANTRELALMILVVEANPFTVEVSRLPVDVSEFEVAALMALASEVVASTPFTVELRTTPLVDRVLELMIEVDEATPFTEVVMVLALLDTPLEEMIDEVAITPLVFRVRVLPVTLADSELMKLVKADWTPLITLANELVVVESVLVLMIVLVATTPLVELVSTFPSEESVFEVTALDVASTPFTVLEIVLPVVESVFVVLEAMAPAKLVVAVTPFTVDDRTTPEVLRALALMILVELATPLTVEVIVLALLDTPLEEMTLEVAVTPLIVVVRVLPDRL